MALTHSFTAKLEERFMGNNARGALVYRVVYLPKSLVKTLGLKPKERARIVGEVDGEPIHLAINPATEGTHFLMVSKQLMRRIEKDLGDRVTVSFDMVDNDAVDIPKELMEGLRRHPEAQDVWHTLSAGKKRIWTTLVDQAKRSKTRARRVDEVIGRLVSGQLDPRKKWRPADR